MAKTRILFRKCCQVGMEDYQLYYRSVEIENVKAEALIKDGWSVYGAEDAPQETKE